MTIGIRYGRRPRSSAMLRSFLRAFLPRPCAPAEQFTLLLELLQEQLGALNDRKTAQLLIDSLGLHDQTGVAALLGGARRETLVKRADKAWEELIDRKRFWR